MTETDLLISSVVTLSILLWDVKLQDNFELCIFGPQDNFVSDRICYKICYFKGFSVNVWLFMISFRRTFCVLG